MLPIWNYLQNTIVCTNIHKIFINRLNEIDLLKAFKWPMQIYVLFCNCMDSISGVFLPWECMFICVLLVILDFIEIQINSSYLILSNMIRQYILNNIANMNKKLVLFIFIFLLTVVVLLL